MISCKDVRQRLVGLSSLRSETIPEPVQDHLLRCPSCSDELALLRLERGILTAAADGPEPSAGFAREVQSALSRLSRRPSVQPAADLWRPAWGLVPAFAATAAALLLLLQVTPATSTQAGFFPTEGLSTVEQLVLSTSQKPDMDQILSAVLGQAEP